MIILTLKLLLAHLLGDFVFQPTAWVAHKKEKKLRSPYLYLHALVHLLCLMIILQFDMHYWLALLIITVTHLLIDTLKLHLQRFAGELMLFVCDQLAHLLVIGWVVYLYYPFSLPIAGIFNGGVVLFATAIVCVTFVSAILMGIILSGWKFEEKTKEESLLNAGKYIGMLERLFVFGFILLNQWQAIGLLIAAKSVFRFSDLSRAKDRKLTEYILTGTLLSFGLAMVTGLLYQYFSKIIGQ